jgi:hypothetical protein
MMKRAWRLAADPILLACLGTVLGFAIALNAQSRYTIEREQRVERRFTMAGTNPRVEVSTVNGSIRLVGHAGDFVEVSVLRSIRAETEADADAAQTSAAPQFLESADGIEIHTDATLRPGCDAEPAGSRQRTRYRVRSAVDIRVPRDTNLRLCAVSGGDIRVEGLLGDFDISHVNGSIVLVDARGSGRVVTVNGDVQGTFAAPPHDALLFKSVSGDLDATFPPTLSADLWLKTFNGGLYTDFDVTSLPAGPVGEQRNGRIVYRANRLGGFRVGGGGPDLTFDAFNGDIRVRSQR